jgi:hypothetical protein
VKDPLLIKILYTFCGKDVNEIEAHTAILGETGQGIEAGKIGQVYTLHNTGSSLNFFTLFLRRAFSKWLIQTGDLPVMLPIL